MATFKSSNDFGTFFLKIAPQHIGFLKFILEGYDNMALVSTINPKDGSILVRYPLAFQNDLTEIIADLSPLIFEKFTRSQTSSSDATSGEDELFKNFWNVDH